MQNLKRIVLCSAMMGLQAHGQTTQVGTILVQQNDSGNAATSVTLTKTAGSSDRFTITGGNRGDYDMDFGNANDVTAGTVVSSIAQNGRDNTAFGDTIGLFYGTSQADLAGGAVRYFIPIHRTPFNTEINMHTAAGFFPYNRWLGGLARNAAGTNGGVTDQLRAHASIRLGTEFRTLGSGVFVLDLRTVEGGGSGTNGVLLVTHAKNEANYATSRANTDGTFSLFVRDNEATGAANEQDPISFVYLPATALGRNGLVAVGRVNSDASTDVLAGPATVTKGPTGIWYVSIVGHDPDTGTLLISPEGGGTNNFDNVVSYQWDPVNQRYEVHSRDIVNATTNPTLQNGATAAEDMFSFAFFRALKAPTVAITAPVAGTTLTAPASVNVVAAASDTDGTVVKVDFYRNGVLVATDETAPYELPQAGLEAGSYTYEARVTDSDGYVVASELRQLVVNLDPLAGTGNRAVWLDGVNDHARLNTAPALGVGGPPSNGMTLECWFRKEGNGAGNPLPLITKGRGEGENNTTDINYSLGLNSSGLLAASFEAFPIHGVTGGADFNAVATHPPVADGVWQHAAVTYDGTTGTWSFYLNGQPAGTVAGTAGALPRFDSVHAVGIGTAFNSTGVPAGAFPGVVDEVRIWNHARTAEQVLNAWNVEVPRAGGLVGRFAFDEGTGNRVTGTAGPRTEGVLVGNPVWVPGAPMVESAPQVEITQPVAGQRLVAGGTVVIAAAVADVPGPVSKVEFFDGVTLLGEVTTAPFVFQWTGATLGGHALRARATDGSGIVTESEVVSIQVVNAPPLLITEVQSDQSATAPLGAADYFEVTNVSGALMDLSGYTWDDSRASFAAAAGWALPAGTTLNAGESLLVTTADAAAFRAWWGLAPTVAVAQTAGAPTLDENDAVVVYDSTGTVVASLSYAAGGFRRGNGLPASGGHAGISGGGAAATALVWNPASGVEQPRYDAAGTAGQSGNGPAVGTDLGSPGSGNGPGAVIATTLALMVEPLWFSESAAAAATGRVTRFGDTSAELVVTLVSSDVTALTVPGTVSIPAGQSSATFAVTPVNDFLVDGPHTAVVAATAPGSSLATQTVVVVDDGDLPPPDLRITEVQSSQSAGAPSGAADYFEITNFSGAVVDLGGFTWSDDAKDPSAAQAWAIAAGSTLAAGESAIVTTMDAAAFRAWWGVGTGVKVFRTAGAPGLGQDDSITLYTNNRVVVTELSWAAGGFARPFGLTAAGGHAGPSAGAAEESIALVYDPASPAGGPARYLAANAFRLGGRRAVTGTDVGSPGVINGSPVPAPEPTLETRGPLQFEHVATVPLAGAEISAFDAASKRLFVTSNSGLQVLAVDDPEFPVLLKVIDFTQAPFNLSSTDVTSVATHSGTVAVSVLNAAKGQPGSVVFLNAATQALLGVVTVGAHPDMVTFTPDGTRVLTADEGEVGAGGADTDTAPGTVTIINVSGGFAAPPVATAGFAAFDAQAAALKAAGVRLFESAPGVLKAPSLDFEPEYVAVSADSTKAMVSLQEANAVALLDIPTATFTAVVPLGEKDFRGLLADFSDRDAPGGSSGIINPTTGNAVFGLYMPDAVASFQAGGQTYYVMANEGDDRDDFKTETIRVGAAGYVLDPTVFPNAAELKANGALGRLTVSNSPGLRGDIDNDGDVDRILAYGGRSISIVDATGNLVYDSGDLIERLVAELGTPWWDDSRSDNKGAEPEGVVIGQIEGRVYAFAGLERARGVMVFDVTDPTRVLRAGFVSLPSDLNPEGLTFVPKAQSPTGKPMLAVTNETSNTLTLFNVSRYTLQLLHLADAEAGLLASQTAPNLAALVDAFEEDYSNTLILAGGDNFIPSPFLNAGTDPAINAVAAVGATAFGRPDMAIHNLIGVEASAIGNHEWDLGSNVFVEAIRPAGAWAGAQFPHLSLNLDYSGDSAALGRFTEVVLDGAATAVPKADTLKGRLVPVAVVEKGGEKIGLVGVTTQLLSTISSPSGTVVKGGSVENLDLLAAQIQPYVDELEAEGVNKIVLLAHLQQLSNERALAGKLRGVDVILAAGSNTRLGDSDDVAAAFPGHAANFADDYPLVHTSLDGRPVLVVNTDNEFTYLGRLVVDFDQNGVLDVAGLAERIDINGAYASTAANVAAAWGVAEGDLGTTAFAAGTKGARVKEVTEAVQSVINAKDGQVHGYTAVYLEGERSFVRGQETNLGNLTADANQAALRAITGGTGPIVSLKNGGGIRAQIGAVSNQGGGVQKLPPPGNAAVGKLDGGISQLDIENALRFNNRLMVFETTPAGLKAILEHGVAAWPNQGRFPQIGGVQFAWDPARPAGERVTSIALLNEDGTEGRPVYKRGPLAAALLASAPSVIQVVTLNFLANDGDGYPIKANGSNFRYLLSDGTLGPVIADEGVNFTVAPQLPGNALGEQAALAGYLQSRHGTLAQAYREEDRVMAEDLRIQNLGARMDTVPPLAGVDSDGDGMSDLEEVLLGSNGAAALRVGDRVDLNLAVYAGPGQTARVVGRLPTGLRFDPVTGRLQGVLAGSAGLWTLQVQVLNGTTPVSAHSLRLAVEAFPARLLAGYEALLRDVTTGEPRGLLRLLVTKPGQWSGTLEVLGMGRRPAKGAFELVEGRDRVELQATFAGGKTAPAATVEVVLDADTPLVSGAYAAGTLNGSLNGFRLASFAGSPPLVRKVNAAFDAGVQDGVSHPAGFGWVKGTVTNRGGITMKGQLGDAQALTLTANLGVTGQTLIWAQPYRDKAVSYVGGVMEVPDLGQPRVLMAGLNPGLDWFKGADAREPSYEAGFAAPLRVAARAAGFTPARTPADLEAALGLTGATFEVEIEGAGLSNGPGSATVLPTAFLLSPSFALITSAPVAPAPAPWAGKAAKADGGWTGTLTLGSGRAEAGGVLLPGLSGTDTVGAGLIRVPVAGGRKGAFRTSSLLLEK